MKRRTVVRSTIAGTRPRLEPVFGGRRKGRRGVTTGNWISIPHHAVGTIVASNAAVAYLDPEHGERRRDAIIGLAGNHEFRAGSAGLKESGAVLLKNAARSFVLMKSCVYPLSRTQISHAREAHIAKLMASADIHGHGDEYCRPSAVLNLASRIAWPAWPTRLAPGCASKYRSRNSDMAFLLPNKVALGR
jgi:hypothetical protein